MAPETCPGGCLNHLTSLKPEQAPVTGVARALGKRVPIQLVDDTFASLRLRLT